MSDNDSNIYSSRIALQIITHMWSLPNSNPLVWEFNGLRQCLLGSLELFDQPEEQLTLLVEGAFTGTDGPITNARFERGDVLRFMHSISNLQKTNHAYPALSQETTEEDFEITFHHFGLPMPSRVEVEECREVCAQLQVNPTNLVTKNQAMMAWFTILKRQGRHMGSKETLARIWTIANPIRDAAIPSKAFIMGSYYLIHKLRDDNFLLPFYLPESKYQTLKAHFETLLKTMDQSNPPDVDKDLRVLNPASTTRPIIDSRFLRFGEALVDKIANEILQTGLTVGVESKKQSKTQQEKNFHVAVRETMKMLMRWDPEDIESDIPASVPAHQVEEFNAGKVSGPRKDNLTIHWEKIACEWNKRAAKVFANHFISLYYSGTFRSTGDFSQAFIREDNLLSAFMDKLYYLCDKRDTLIIQRKGTTEMNGILEEESAIIAKRNRRRSRKVSLYNARKKALLRFLTSTDYGAWTQMLDLLGVDGTSSDETEEEIEGSRNCRVERILKPWRSEEINVLLKALDAASLAPDLLGRKPRGHQRRRLRTGNHSTLINTDLSSLKYPRNFYNIDWIKEHKPGLVDILMESWGVPLKLPSIS